MPLVHLSRFLIAAATRVIGGAIKIMIDFEKANSKLEAVLGATGDEMKQLSTQAKELGGTTAFTATEVTGLQIEFAKLGFPTEDIVKMTAATLDGAAALGSDLGEQAALTGALLKQFSLDADEAGRVNDVLALSASKSALDFTKLSTALPIVGATADAAGVSLERTTSLLGTLSNRGIDASTSATALRNIFLELAKEGLTFEEAMAEINTATDKNAKAFELFGKRGATVGVILSQTAETTEELEQQLLNAEGAAKKMADTMLDNLAGDITIANSAWEGFVLALLEGDSVVSNTSRNLIQGSTSILQFATDLLTGADAIENFTKRSVESAIATGEISSEVNELGFSMADLTKASLENEVVFKGLNKALKDGRIDADKYAQGIKALADGVKILNKEQREAARVTREKSEAEAEDAKRVKAAELLAAEQLVAGIEERKKKEKEEKESEKKRNAAAKKSAKDAQKIIDDRLKREQDAINKAKDEELKNLNKFLDDKEKLETEASNAAIGEEETEINAVRDKFFNIIELAKEHNEDTVVLEEELQRQLQLI